MLEHSHIIFRALYSTLPVAGLMYIVWTYSSGLLLAWRFRYARFIDFLRALRAWSGQVIFLGGLLIILSAVTYGQPDLNDLLLCSAFAGLGLWIKTIPRRSARAADNAAG